MIQFHFVVKLLFPAMQQSVTSGDQTNVTFSSKLGGKFAPPVFPSCITVGVTVAKTALATRLLLTGWRLSKATVRIPVELRNSGCISGTAGLVTC